VLDIGLPEMDGNELARRLRAQPGTSGAVLVAVTGYGQQHDRDKALDAGFDHHFTKPVDIDKLNALLLGLVAPV
jgi:CheY-like chemotaxis protein